jgi:hypothetical protein
VPLSLLSEPASYSGTQLITKNALDAAIAGSSSG